jgi:hypothetical protein
VGFGDVDHLIKGLVSFSKRVTGSNLKKGEKKRIVTPHCLEWLPRAQDKL